MVYLVLLDFVGLNVFLTWGDFDFYWWCVFFFVFLVKLPVYGVHLWLPKAHVEAPVSGSMVLAGVLLKIGAYGMVRFRVGVSFYLSFYKGIFVSLGVLGGLYRAFLCFRQVDLKSFIAYSSVCHIGFGLGGLYSGSFLGFSGGVFIIIGHGFCSSCLFYFLYVLYERFYSRRALVLKGVSFFFPLARAVLFIFSVLNMGVPPSFSFFSEVLIFSGVIGFGVFNFV